jgi:hypothetical protein
MGAGLGSASSGRIFLGPARTDGSSCAPHRADQATRECIENANKAASQGALARAQTAGTARLAPQLPAGSSPVSHRSSQGLFWSWEQAWDHAHGPSRGHLLRCYLHELRTRWQTGTHGAAPAACMRTSGGAWHAHSRVAARPTRAASPRPAFPPRWTLCPR